MCSALLCLLTLTGSVGALTLFAVQSQVTGLENGSTMLDVSYQTNKEIQWLQIRWELVSQPIPVQLAICTIQAQDSSNQKSIRMYPPKGFEKRMSIIPDNGSLIIQHLKMNDSGTYRVSVLDSNLTVSTSIKLTVSDIIYVTANYVTCEGPEIEHVEIQETQPVAEGHCICPSYNSTMDVATSAWIFFSSRLSSTFIILLVLFRLLVKNKKPQRHRKLKMLSTNRYCK